MRPPVNYSPADLVAMRSLGIAIDTAPQSETQPETAIAIKVVDVEKRRTRKALSWMSDEEYDAYLVSRESALELARESHTFTCGRAPAEWRGQDLANLIEHMLHLIERFPLTTAKWRADTFGLGYVMIHRYSGDTVHIDVRGGTVFDLEATVTSLNRRALADWFVMHAPGRITWDGRKGSLDGCAEVAFPAARVEHERPPF